MGFERLLIKERRKPRFTKGWRTSLISECKGNTFCKFMKSQVLVTI